MFDRRILLPLFGVLGLASWLAWELRPPPADGAAASRGGGRNVFLGADPRVDELAPLLALDWADVAGTLEAVGRDSVARDRIIAETSTQGNAPTRYLRGLLLLAKGEVQAAAAVLADIPVREIPPEYLYAPYRMYDALGRTEPNPFRAPIVQAAADGRTSAVVAARVAGREGDLPGALRAYLRSDPAQWTSSDVEILSSLRWHAGLAVETKTMLKAALRSGRIADSLRKPLVALVSVEGERTAVAQLQTRVAELMRADATGREPFAAALEGQLQLRVRFLRRDYAGLIATYRGATDLNLPDETLLLLVLSAAHEHAVGEFDRWCRELRRRFPDPSVASWLQTLLVAPPR